MGSNSASDSECALISDFDSTMRRFESSRPSQHSGVRSSSPGNARLGVNARFPRVRFRLQTPNSVISGRQLPKVSSHDREYSRFADTVGGDSVRSRLPPAGRSLKCSRIELGWISGRVGVRCRSRHSRPGDPARHSSGFYRHQHARFHGRHKARRLQAIDGRPCTAMRTFANM